jgi:prepilin-type N-terminal cleavage/methylation domain-containing protein
MSHQGRVPTKTAGFTLIETMMVLAVFGIIVGIGTPKLSTALSGAQERSAVNRFASAHSLARATAIRHGRRAELRIDASNGQFWIEVDTTGLGGIAPRIGPVKSIARALTLTRNRAVLCFNGRGLPTTQGSCESPDATVVIAAPGRVDTLTITVLGKVLR